MTEDGGHRRWLVSEAGRCSVVEMAAPTVGGQVPGGPPRMQPGLPPPCPPLCPPPWRDDWKGRVRHRRHIPCHHDHPAHWGTGSGQLPKLNVAGSIPVARSQKRTRTRPVSPQKLPGLLLFRGHAPHHAPHRRFVPRPPGVAAPPPCGPPGRPQGSRSGRAHLAAP